MSRCAFFAQRRRFLDRLAAFLPPLRLAEPQRRALLDRLLDLGKSFPDFACAALGRPVSRLHALAALREALPDLDLRPFDEIAALRRGERSTAGPEALQGLLRQVFVLADQIEERILASPTARWCDLVARDGSEIPP